MPFSFTEGKQSRRNRGGAKRAGVEQIRTDQNRSEQIRTVKRFTLTNGLLFFSLIRWRKDQADQAIKAAEGS